VRHRAVRARAGLALGLALAGPGCGTIASFGEGEVFPCCGVHEDIFMSRGGQLPAVAFLRVLGFLDLSPSFALDTVLLPAGDHPGAPVTIPVLIFSGEP